jgi:NADH-quinone oxidoreductase subunit E
MANQAVDESEAGRLPDDNDVFTLLDELKVTDESNLIAVLQDVQERFGFLPRPALEEISLRTGIPLSRIYGVVTFYAQFHTEPRGRHTVRCCHGTACHVKGAGGVLGAIERTLGITEGETTEDMMFYFETVACLGTCFLAPVIMIDDQYFGNLTAQKVEKVLRSFGDKQCRNV